MKKKLILLFITFSLLLTSCSFLNDNKSNDDLNESYTITYEFNNGLAPETQTINSDSSYYMIKSEDIKKDGYIFDCWCSDKDLKYEYDFTSPITNNITLYARYILDFQYLTNKLTQDIMSTCVTIENEIFKNNIAIGGSRGSGVIYKKTNNKHYVLTNNHVIYTTAKSKYTIIDYIGNEFEATLLKYDPNYDLALLTFESINNYYISPMADTNPTVNENVIALGNPEGQKNAISYGTIYNYKKVSLNTSSEQSNIQFECVNHSAYIMTGSSGGPLLNTSFELIGVNYAGSLDDKGNFYSGLTIPIKKVQEFINN